MRKLMLVLTMTIGYFAVAGAMTADEPPACDPSCPWVR